MSEDWSISPPLRDKVFPWEKYNPVTREEVNEFFHSLKSWLSRNACAT